MYFHIAELNIILYPYIQFSKILFLLMIVECCQSVSFLASEPVKSTLDISRMGGYFEFYDMGSNARPIYRNSDQKYLFVNSLGLWVVFSTMSYITYITIPLKYFDV